MKIAAAFLVVALSCCFEAQAATIPGNCIKNLLENGAPSLVEKLGNLLCKYEQARETQNQMLFLAFLNELNVVVTDVGCTLDNLFGTHVEPTLNTAEEIADKVALVVFDILNGLPVTTRFMEVACGTLEHLLAKLKSVMETIRETLDKVVNKLGVQQRVHH